MILKIDRGNLSYPKSQIHWMHTRTITSENVLQAEQGNNIEKLSFKHIISKYTLDFKQSVAFEIMACSFILKSLKVHNISEDNLHQFFKEDESKKNKYTGCLKGFKKSMSDKGD